MAKARNATEVRSNGPQYVFSAASVRRRAMHLLDWMARVKKEVAVVVEAAEAATVEGLDSGPTRPMLFPTMEAATLAEQAEEIRRIEMGLTFADQLRDVPTAERQTVARAVDAAIEAATPADEDDEDEDDESALPAETVTGVKQAVAEALA